MKPGNRSEADSGANSRSKRLLKDEARMLFFKRAALFHAARLFAIEKETRIGLEEMVVAAHLHRPVARIGHFGFAVGDLHDRAGNLPARGRRTGTGVHGPGLGRGD